jgi:hypothetical protein
MNMANKLKIIGRRSSLRFVLGPAPFHGIRIVIEVERGTVPIQELQK